MLLVTPLVCARRSGVVHAASGFVSLIALCLLGPRDGVSFKGGKRFAPAGQSVAMQTVGVLTLWFGWFGFNGVSTSFHFLNPAAAARAMAMTSLSGAAGALSATGLTHLIDKNGQIHITSLLNGLLSGLVRAPLALYRRSTPRLVPLKAPSPCTIVARKGAQAQQRGPRSSVLTSLCPLLSVALAVARWRSRRAAAS